MYQNIKKYLRIIVFFLTLGYLFLFILPPKAEAITIMPTFKASGTFTAGTGAITPPYPTGGGAPVAGDIALLVVTSENETISLTTANGFVELGAQANKNVGTGASDPSSRLAVYWKRCVGGDSAPVVADSGNNTEGQIYLFSGVSASGDPWDVYAEGNDSAANDTTGVIPGTTTTVANTLVVLISSSSYNAGSTTEFASWSNGALTNIQERGDNTDTANLGGGHGLATAERAATGSYGDTTVTLAHTSYKGAMSIALKPLQAITVSGSSNIGEGTVVRVAINGSLSGQTGTVTSGSWQITEVTQPSTNQIMTVFATDGDGDIDNSLESSAIGKYSGSGNMTDMVLNINTLSVGGTGAQSIAVSDLVTANYDADQDEDIMYDAETGSLLVQAAVNTYDAEKIDILTTDTLTLSGSETLTTHHLTITGALTSTTTSAYNVAGTWTNNGTFTQASSTVTLNGSGSQTVNGTTETAFYNLTVSNTSAAIAVSTNMSIASSGTLNMNGASTILNPGSGVVISGSGTLTGSGTVQVTRTTSTADFGSQYSISNKTLTNLTVEYTSTGQVLTNTTYGHLKISSNAISTGANSATVGGTFTVGASGVFTPSSGTMIFNNNASIVNSGSLTFQGISIAASATVTTTASFNIAGTLTVGSSGNFSPGVGSTITMSNAAWAISNSSGTLAFKGLTIDATPSSQPTDNFSVSGTLIINNGKNLSPTNGIITMTGTVWGITNSGTLVFKNLTIDGTPSPQPTANFSVSGALTINSGKTLAPTDGTITMTGGSIANNGGSTTNLVFNNLTVTSITSTSSDFTVNKTLNVSGGNLTPSNGTITMATTSWAITNSGTLIFKGLTISETPSVSGQPTSSFSVSGALTVNSGKTLAPTDGTITMTGGSIVNNGSATTNLVFNNLTVSGTTSTSSDFTVNGTLNVSGGNLTPSNGTITMATTSWAITNSGTLVFSGLTISETPSVSGQPTSSFFVSGALTINSGKTLAPTDGTITMTGGSIVNNGGSTTNLVFNNLTVTGTTSTGSDFTVNKTLNVNGGNLTPSGGIITMATTSWAITNSGTLIFKGLTISETPSVSGQPTSSFFVSGALTVNNGKTLAPTDGTITMTGGSIVNNGGATTNLVFNNLTVSGTATTASDFTINKTLNVSGSFTASTGTITMATTSWVITNSGTLVFSGLTISETPSVSGQPTSSFYIGGTLTINSGKNLAPTAGTITMTGTSWGITNPGSLTFYNWTVDGTASPQPTASFSVANTLTVNSGKNLSPTAGTITMTGGSIANSGTLNFYNLIVSGSTSTTSTFAIVNDLTVNGTLTVSSGTGIITANGNITGSGTMTLTAGTFQQVVATDKTFGSSSNANAWTFNNLKFNNSSASNARKITPNAGTGDIIIGASGTLTLGDSGTQTITFDNEAANDRFFDINGNFTISTQGIFLASSSKDFKIAGSYSNSGTFTANSGTVTFDATSGSKTIDAGNSTFYDVVFNSSSGGWTIQINNLTTTRNLTITDVSSLAIAASKTVEVDGTYSVADAEADDITWNSNSVLYLKSGTPYTVGTKNQAAATYAILQIGADTDIRMWNSTAATFYVAASGSLYSQDHANINGDLYIWGDYHTQTAENPDHDYWSYATDFDGTNLTSGSERGVNVRIDPSSNVTADSGDTLAAIGVPGNRTTVSRQGASNGYGIVVAGGGTINFQYTDFDYLDGNKGLDIQASANVTSLSYTTFNNLVGTTALDDTFITVASTVIGIGTSAVFTGVQINNNGAGAEFNVNLTGDTLTGYWDFDASTGDFDGEAFDGDDGINEADPGMLRWDNSNVAPSSPTSLLTEGETNPTNVADNTPEFSAIYNDLNIGDTANTYQIQMADNQSFTDPIWDSGQQSMTNCGKDNRCQDISYAGSALSEGVTYYWRIKFWDIAGLGGAWNTEEAYFQLVWTANRFRFRDIRLRDLRVKPTN